MAYTKGHQKLNLSPVLVTGGKPTVGYRRGVDSAKMQGFVCVFLVGVCLRRRTG